MIRYKEVRPRKKENTPLDDSMSTVVTAKADCILTNGTLLWH